MSKKDVPAMISAAGWISGLVDGLYKDLVAKGASPEEIHSLVTDGGVLPIGKIGDALMDVVRRARGITGHVIDCDAPAFAPNGWEVLPNSEQLLNRVRGNIVFDPKKVSLFLSEEQKTGTVIGHDLRKELADKLVLNANVLDYLLAHIEFIPEEWKGKHVFFWGTIYRGSVFSPCVRYLYWHGSRWNCYHRWLEDAFNSDFPAALLIS